MFVPRRLKKVDFDLKEIYISKPERCQPCFLKRKKAQAQRGFFEILIPFKVFFDTTSGTASFIKIVSALTNRRAIDKNNKTALRGDEREQL
jgi:hypothetical protein